MYYPQEGYCSCITLRQDRGKTGYHFRSGLETEYRQDRPPFRYSLELGHTHSDKTRHISAVTMIKDTDKTGHLSDMAMRQDILRQDSEGIEAVQVMRQDIIQTVTSHNTGNEAGHKTDSEKG